MILRDQIHAAVDHLANDQLNLVYEYIKLLEQRQKDPTRSRKNRPKLTLKQLHSRYAKLEQSNWSDAVIAEREERV